jgi:hypothetical protein
MGFASAFANFAASTDKSLNPSYNLQSLESQSAFAAALVHRARRNEVSLRSAFRHCYGAHGARHRGVHAAGFHRRRRRRAVPVIDRAGFGRGRTAADAAAKAPRLALARLRLPPRLSVRPSKSSERARRAITCRTGRSTTATARRGPRSTTTAGTAAVSVPATRRRRSARSGIAGASKRSPDAPTGGRAFTRVHALLPEVAGPMTSSAISRASFPPTRISLRSCGLQTESHGRRAPPRFAFAAPRGK